MIVLIVLKRSIGFESTLHEIECNDGQLLAMLRSWDGDHFLCLLEVWRRYIPEVSNAAHYIMFCQSQCVVVFICKQQTCSSCYKSIRPVHDIAMCNSLHIAISCITHWNTHTEDSTFQQPLYSGLSYDVACIHFCYTNFSFNIDNTFCCHILFPSLSLFRSIGATFQLR